MFKLCFHAQVQPDCGDEIHPNQGVWNLNQNNNTHNYNCYFRRGTDAVLEEDFQQKIQVLENVRTSSC